ncbi:MAG: histidine kinase [Gammaproteobacteria bacterium]|nr:histidine kinase [Gammaproteobacteria bacterium]MCK5092124.1 histidine kinase [Gammaproteobacteria bacterium]
MPAYHQPQTQIPQIENSAHSVAIVSTISGAEDKRDATVNTDSSPGDNSQTGSRFRFKILNHSCLRGPAISLLIFTALLISSAFILSGQYPSPSLVYVQVALLVLIVVSVCFLLYRINNKLILPLEHLHKLSKDVRKVKFKGPTSPDYKTRASDMIEDISNLGRELVNLSNNMDLEVSKQTERIAQKNRTLEVLYEIAARINISGDLEDLLKRFLPTLKDVLNAKTATVRLTNYDGQMRLIGDIGLDKHKTETAVLLPVLHCMHGKNIQDIESPTGENVLKCEKYPGQPYFNDDNIEMIAVPLEYRSKNLGVYNLFIEKPGLVDHEDTKELLLSIGRHLGVAIERAHMDDEARRISIHQERNMLSHELHDSLAQTLASLRFQVRNLDDSLDHQDNEAARKETLQIKAGLDEAYSELRELLAHFRAPFDERGLVASIENAIDRFRKKTNIHILLQNQWKLHGLPSVLEMQVLRIVQEALNNIHKHSQAHTVRVLLRSEDNGKQTVLIEDDGIGIVASTLESKPGENIGLSIMQERAHRLGGQLQIESEKDEGTRIILTFIPDKNEQYNLLRTM